MKRITELYDHTGGVILGQNHIYRMRDILVFKRIRSVCVFRGYLSWFDDTMFVRQFRKNTMQNIIIP